MMNKRPELLATCIYLAVGAFWIVFTDVLVQYITSTSTSFTAEELQLAKGLFYIVITGVLVYALVRSSTRAMRRFNSELEQRVAERTAELGYTQEELLAARSRMEEVNRELSESNQALQTRNRDLAAFSYSISHDLRAPVRAVTGFAEIISRRHGAELPEEARHYLENILVASGRMDRLINDLLRYTQLGAEPLKFEVLKLDRIITEISREFIPTLTAMAGSLRWDTSDVRVAGKRALIEQILSNLVQNAIRYRSPERPPEIVITVSRVDGRVEIAVADNGIGIPPEHHERVFSLFQRLHSDDHDGTGIGLALARRAAEILRGTLTVQSTPGTGSTFILTFPEVFP